jgi:hypothetical protein
MAAPRPSFLHRDIESMGNELSKRWMTGNRIVRRTNFD